MKPLNLDKEIRVNHKVFEKLKKYHFTDDHGHPLENCVEFIALTRHLRWTKEPPTESGWYFCQRICPGAPKHYPLRVVHIHYDECMGKRVLCYGGCAWYGVGDDRQESSPLCDISKSVLEEMYWAGPIQEPLDTSPQA